MATFIPQVQGHLATVEAFQPDYGFIQGWLETKQGKYNEGLAQINSAYSLLKDLPLTLDENISKRDQFFATADSQIKKMASMDLSLDQNVMAAKSIFNPLATDEALLEDFGITTQAYAVMNTANRFRNSGDEETRKRYNPLSVNYAALKLEEYKISNSDRRTQIAGQGIKYVDNVNVMERATAIADKLKLDITAPVGTSADGAYDITARNGDLILGTLSSAIRAQLSSDPLVAEYFNQQGYVAVQSELQARAKEIGYEGAQAEMIQKYVTDPALLAQAQQDAQQNKQALNGLYTEKELAERSIESDGVVPGSPEHERYLKILKSIETLEASDVSLTETVQKIESGAYDPKMETAYYNAGIFSMNAQVGESAQYLSMRNSEIKRTPNEYFKMRRQHEYAIALADHNLANKKEYKRWEEENYGAAYAANNNPFIQLMSSDPKDGSFLPSDRDADGETPTSLDAQKQNLNQLAEGIAGKQSAWIEAMIALDPERMNAVGINSRSWGNATDEQKAKMLKDAEVVYNGIETSADARSYPGQTLTQAAKLRSEYLTYAGLVSRQRKSLAEEEALIIRDNVAPGNSPMEKQLYALLLKPDGTRRSKKEFVEEAKKTKWFKENSDPGFGDYAWATIAALGSPIALPVEVGARLSQNKDLLDMIDDTWEDFQDKINDAYLNTNATDVRAPFIGGSVQSAAGGAGGLNIPSVTATYTSGKKVNPNALPFTELYSAMTRAGVEDRVYNGALTEGGMAPSSFSSKEAEAALSYLTQALSRSIGKDNENVPRPQIKVTQFAGANKDETAVEITFDEAWINKNRVTDNANTSGRPIPKNIKNTLTVMVPSNQFYAPSLGTSEAASEWNTVTGGIGVPVRVPGVVDGEFEYSNGTLSFNGNFKVFDPITGKYKIIADPMQAGNAANPARYSNYVNARQAVWDQIQQIANTNALNRQLYNEQNGVKDPRQLQE